MTPIADDSSSATRRWFGIALLALVSFVAFGNALHYSSIVANPVISQDAWYMLDALVSKDLGDELTLRDFFSKRDATDHSQPLHRLLLLANLHAVDLDFWFEGLLGVLLAALCAVLLIALALDRQRLTVGAAAIIALIPLTLFSLNAQENYFWSLVGLFYLTLPLTLALFWIGARGKPPFAIGLMTLLVMVVMDGAGLLAAMALLGTLLIAGCRAQRWRSLWPSGLAIVTAVVLYRIAYDTLMPPVPTGAGVDFDAALSAVFATAHSAWFSVSAPPAAALAHRDHFAVWFGADAPWAIGATATVVLALHGAFWVSVVRRPLNDPRSFLAVALMLWAYAMVAGIVFARIPRFGIDYLWQHRYINGYQLATIALVLQWLAVRATRTPTTRFRRVSHGLLPTLALIGFGWLQYQLSTIAYTSSQYIAEFNVNMASNLYCLANHPREPNPHCVPHHAVCGWGTDTRARLVGLLVEHQLNVFSPVFQERHGMSPEKADLGFCLR
jgi:hypothetical protein